MPNVKRALVMGLRATAPTDHTTPNAPNFADDVQNSAPAATGMTTSGSSMRPLQHRKGRIEPADQSIQVVGRHDSRASSGKQPQERSRQSQDSKKLGGLDNPEGQGERQPPKRQANVQSTEPRQEVPQSSHAQPLPARAGRRLAQSPERTPTRFRGYQPRNTPKRDSEPQTTRRVNTTLPTLSPLEKNLTDHFGLGDLVLAKKESGQLIPGHLNFTNAPAQYSIPRQDLPDLLQGLHFERLVQEAIPREESLQAPFKYGGNNQSFALWIVAPVAAVDYHLKRYSNLIFRIFTRAIWQAGVAGWDAENPTPRPLFVSGRWTPAVREWQWLGSELEQVQGICVRLSEYERATKAVAAKLEVHVDFAGDLTKGGKFQFILRGEGVLKFNTLGVMWQVSRLWLKRIKGLPTPGWEKARSFLDIKAMVTGQWNRKRKEVHEWAEKEVRRLEAEMDAQARRLADGLGDFQEAEGLGIKAEFNTDGSSMNYDLPPGISNVPIRGRVDAAHGLPQGWTITFPMVVKMVREGGQNRKKLTIEPAVHDMLLKVGVPAQEIDVRSTNLPPEEQEALKLGVCVRAQVIKAFEGALFANLNCTPGTVYAGFYLDTGIVLPIVVLVFPSGTGGASSRANLKKGVVGPLWVKGVSVQIFGNRNERVATAGIVIV